MSLCCHMLLLQAMPSRELAHLGWLGKGHSACFPLLLGGDLLAVGGIKRGWNQSTPHTFSHCVYTAHTGICTIHRREGSA